MKKEKVNVLGGGIAGLSIAIALQQQGYEVNIYEKAPSIQPLGAGLVLAANAMACLKRLGLDQQVIPRGKALQELQILDHKGNIIRATDSRQTSARYGLDNFAIHRGALHEVLLAELPAESIHTGYQAQHIQQTENGWTLHFTNGQSLTANWWIIADGVHSAIRQQLIPGAAPRYAGYTCWRGIIRHDLNLNSTSETWGPGGRFGIVPLADNQLYWFATVNAPAHSEQHQHWGIHELKAQFANYHAPIQEILSLTPPEALLWNDIIDVRPISHYAFPGLLLAGDAAHATTPNMGQGACQALEDAACLLTLTQRNYPLQECFHQFEQLRIQKTHWITRQSFNAGAVAQWTNPLACYLRNSLLKHIPERIQAAQLDKIYQVNF